MRRLVALARGRAAGALVAQLLQALTSLGVQLVALRVLDLADAGTVALLLAVLVLATAGHVGWVGDSLTVLDRTDPPVRSTLQRSVAVDAVGGGLLCGVGLVVLGATGPATAACFALLVGLWLVEETFRRLLMARLEFWRVVVVDAAAFTVSLGALGVGGLLGVPATVPGVVLAMALGQAAGVAAGLLLTPVPEWAPRPHVPGGLRVVAAVGAWRALQSAVRPLMLLLLRVLVVAFLSRAVVAELEAARLFVAPGLQVVNGAGSFLLPTLAAREKRGQEGGDRYAAVATAGLVALTLLGTAVAAVAVLPLGDVVSGGDFTVSVLAVVAWGAYGASLAATMPFASLATARRAARGVFGVRLVEAALGVALVAVVLAAGAGASWTPFAPALAGVLGALGMREVARRAGRVPAPAALA